MSAKNVRSRVDALERGSGKTGLVVVCLRDGESREQSIERTLADAWFRERDRTDRQMIVLNERDSRL